MIDPTPDTVNPSYMSITGSGIPARSQAIDKPDTGLFHSERNANGASINTGSGAAAGAAPTFGGSGVA